MKHICIEFIHINRSTAHGHIEWKNRANNWIANPNEIWLNGINDSRMYDCDKIENEKNNKTMIESLFLHWFRWVLEMFFVTMYDIVKAYNWI